MAYRTVCMLVAIVLILALCENHYPLTSKKNQGGAKEAPYEIHAGPILSLVEDKAFFMDPLVIMFTMGSQII